MSWGGSAAVLVTSISKLLSIPCSLGHPGLHHLLSAVVRALSSSAERDSLEGWQWNPAALTALGHTEEEPPQASVEPLSSWGSLSCLASPTWTDFSVLSGWTALPRTSLARGRAA